MIRKDRLHVSGSESLQDRRQLVGTAAMGIAFTNAGGFGGRFAAWEQPKLFSAEMHAAFRSVR